VTGAPPRPRVADQWRAGSEGAEPEGRRRKGNGGSTARRKQKKGDKTKAGQRDRYGGERHGEEDNGMGRALVLSRDSATLFIWLTFLAEKEKLK
jgi:hypothetical protein